MDDALDALSSATPSDDAPDFEAALENLGVDDDSDDGNNRFDSALDALDMPSAVVAQDAPDPSPVAGVPHHDDLVAPISLRHEDELVRLAWASACVPDAELDPQMLEGRANLLGDFTLTTNEAARPDPKRISNGRHSCRCKH